MGKALHLRVPVLRNGFWCVIAILLLSFRLMVNAGLIQSSLSTTQSITGGALKVNGNLTATDRGFSKAGSAVIATGSNCSTAVLFPAMLGTANNAITSGDMVYDVQLNTTATTPASQCYIVTLVISSGGAILTYNIPVKNNAANVAGESLDLKFDIGSSVPLSPFSFQLYTTP
jgi:hypothetical protein